MPASVRADVVVVPGRGHRSESAALVAEPATAGETVADLDLDSWRSAMNTGVCEILGTEVASNAPLMSAGLDSLAAVVFTNAISDEFGMAFPAVMLFDHPTVDSIVSYLGAEVVVPGGAGRSQQSRVCGQTGTHGIVRVAVGSRGISMVGLAFQVSGVTRSESGMRKVVSQAVATPSSIPVVRWAAPAYEVGASAAYGSFLETDGLGLDGKAFGILAPEARSMDPQQKFVLHAGYIAAHVGAAHGLRTEADARNVRDSLVYSDTGVYVGVEPSGIVTQEVGDVFSASGAAASITSGRFSYVLGLVGPCLTIDTACSSTLAAVHTCTVALLNAECDSAVGVGTKALSEASNYGTALAGMTSPRGRCHTFDGRADGYCRGEGCGAFCLDGDGVEEEDARRRTAHRLTWIDVLGSAVQQDGPSASLTAPNGSSQR